MIAPCMDCEFRREGCHGVCEPYKEYQAEWQKIRKKRKENADIAEVEARRANKIQADHGWSLKRNK